jgi:DNA-binding Lrp family transcriptional regulator
MPQRTALDRTDLAILRALQKDARISNKELAAHVRLAPSTCLERVRGLRARGVVRGYHAEVDPAALGRDQQALIAVRIRPHTRQIVDAFWRHVLDQPETVAVFHVSGADDFLVHASFRDPAHLRDFLLDRVAARREVAHLETHLIFAQERKPVLEPLDA